MDRLLRGAAPQLRQGSRRHADGGADLRLAASFGAGDEGIVGDHKPDGAGGEQGVGHRLVVIPEPFLGADEHTRNNSAGACGGGGDNAAHGRIHLGNRQGVGHGPPGVGTEIGGPRLRRMPHHLAGIAAGEPAAGAGVLRQPALHRFLHDAVIFRHLAVNRLLRHAGFRGLLPQHHPPDGEIFFRTQLCQLVQG
ncbi:hypothetical protein D3C75_618500 [compost metagenome]